MISLVLRRPSSHVHFLLFLLTPAFIDVYKFKRNFAFALTTTRIFFSQWSSCNQESGSWIDGSHYRHRGRLCSGVYRAGCWAHDLLQESPSETTEKGEDCCRKCVHFYFDICVYDLEGESVSIWRISWYSLVQRDSDWPKKYSQPIDGLEWVAAIWDELTIEANVESFVIVLQHGDKWRHMQAIYKRVSCSCAGRTGAAPKRGLASLACKHGR